MPLLGERDSSGRFTALENWTDSLRNMKFTLIPYCASQPCTDNSHVIRQPYSASHEGFSRMIPRCDFLLSDAHWLSIHSRSYLKFNHLFNCFLFTKLPGREGQLFLYSPSRGFGYSIDTMYLSYTESLHEDCYPISCMA